jgi:hypothetical protein
MTRSKELRRIEAALTHRHEAELRWALAFCEERRRAAAQVASLKGTTVKHSDRLYRIERRVKAALDELATR